MEYQFNIAKILPGPSKGIRASDIPSLAGFLLGVPTMKEIPLGQSGKVALVDDDDYDTVSRFTWNTTRYHNAFYARVVLYMGHLNGKAKYCRVFMHQLILRPPKRMEVDHINHNGLDNRRSNIRIVTHQQNMHNIRVLRRHTSKYQGVSWSSKRGKWVACIEKDGRCVFLGYYSSEVKAARAYNAASKSYRGQYAYVNTL